VIAQIELAIIQRRYLKHDTGRKYFSRTNRKSNT